MKRNLKIALTTGVMSVLACGSAFAADANSGIAAASSAITAAGTDLLASAAPIITSGIGIGLTFWGGKLLWSKFRSMAK